MCKKNDIDTKSSFKFDKFVYITVVIMNFILIYSKKVW